MLFIMLSLFKLAGKKISRKHSTVQILVLFSWKKAFHFNFLLAHTKKINLNSQLLPWNRKKVVWIKRGFCTEISFLQSHSSICSQSCAKEKKSARLKKVWKKNKMRFFGWKCMHKSVAEKTGLLDFFSNYWPNLTYKP